MNDKDFDKFINQSLENFSSEVPEDMWQKIEKRRKRRLLPFFTKWYFATSILLITATGSYYYFTKNNTGNLIAETALQNIKADSTTNKNDAQNLVIEKKHIPGTIVSADTNFSSINSIIENTNSIKKSNRTFIDKSNFKNTNKLLVQNQNDFTNSPANNNVLNKPGISNAADNNNSNTKNAGSSTYNTNNILQTQDAVANPLTSSENKTVKTPLYSKDPEEMKEFVESPKNYLTLEVYASPEIPFFKISGNENYSNLHKSVSKSQLSYSFGARISGPLGKHFFWKTGFQFEHTNESFHYTDANDNFYSSKNKYSNVNILLLVGYQKNFNKLTLSASAGILVNVHTKNSGQMVNTIPEVINISTGNIYKTNPGSSLYIGGMAALPVNKKIQIFAEPHYRLQLSNMASNPQPFTQKINSLGVNFGARMYLFKTPQSK